MRLRSYSKKFSIQISVAFTYYLAALVALNFATISGNMTLIWPTSGLALACINKIRLSVCYRRFSWRFCCWSFVGNPHYVSGLIALGNTLEPIAAIYFLRTFPFSANLYHLHDYQSLILAGSMGAIASAIMGGIAITFAGFIADTIFLYTHFNIL